MLGGWLLFIQQMLNRAPPPVYVRGTSVVMQTIRTRSVAVGVVHSKSVIVSLARGNSKAGP